MIEEKFIATHQRRHIMASDMQAKLRKVAARVGYIAHSGPRVGDGSVLAFIDALDDGEVLCVRLSPNDQKRLGALLDYAVKFRRSEADLVEKVKRGLV